MYKNDTNKLRFVTYPAQNGNLSDNLKEVICTHRILLLFID